MDDQPVATTAAQRAFLRTELSSYLDDCPLDNQNPPACPFHETRRKSLEERAAWLAGLSEEAILNLHTYCQICCERKTTMGTATSPGSSP